MDKYCSSFGGKKTRSGRVDLTQVFLHFFTTNLISIIYPTIAGLSRLSDFARARRFLGCLQHQDEQNQNPTETLNKSPEKIGKG